ncbi:MAG: hypothetical protein U0S36_09760 [Candidatus Nanopelagicales bacterium]
MQLHLRRERGTAHGRGVGAVHEQAAVALRRDLGAGGGRGDRGGQLGGLRRAHHDAVAGLDQLGERAGPHERAARHDDDVVDRLLDLAEHVARDEHRAALAGEVAQERAQPRDALGVEAVGRLVEHEDAGVAEERGRELEPLAHAQREPADRAAGDVLQAHEREHLVGPALVDPARAGDDAQVVARAAPGVEAGGLERRADDAGRGLDVVVATTADGRGAAGR